MWNSISLASLLLIVAKSVNISITFNITNSSLGNLTCYDYPFCMSDNDCYFTQQTCDTTNAAALAFGCGGLCDPYNITAIDNPTYRNCTMVGFCDANGDGCGAENICDTDFAGYFGCGGLCTEPLNCTSYYGAYCDMYGDGCMTGLGYYCSNETFANCYKCMSNDTTTMYNCTDMGYECDEYAINDCASDEYCDAYYGNCGMCTAFGFGTTEGMVNCTMYYGVDYCDTYEDSCGADEYCDGSYAGYNCGMCMPFGFGTTDGMVNCTYYYGIDYCDEYGDDCEDDEYCDGSYAMYNCGMCMSMGMDTTMDMGEMGTTDSMEAMDTTDDSMENMGTTDDSMESMSTTDSMENMGTTDSMESMGTTDDSMEEMGTTDSMEGMGTTDSMDDMGTTMDMDGMATTNDKEIIVTKSKATYTFTVIIAIIFGTAVYGFM